MAGKGVLFGRGDKQMEKYTGKTGLEPRKMDENGKTNYYHGESGRRYQT